MMAWRFLMLASVVLFMTTFWQRVQSDRQQRRLHEAFYQLLEQNNGQVSLIQLATAARSDAYLAQDYLEAQAKVFGAALEVDADGDAYYRFPKLKRIGDSC